MKSESKARKSDKKALGQLVVLPVFDTLSIQNEISSSFAPILKQRELMRQFFQQNANVIQDLVKQMNHAVETYRHVFEAFGNLREQIQKAQKEREHIMASVTQVVNSWNHFAPHIPTTRIVVSQPIPQTQAVALHQSNLVEAITNRVIEKIEERVKENTPKLLVGTATIVLPPGASWGSITFAFIDDASVEIHHGRKHVGRFNKEDLKFVKTNTKDKKPNNAWWFLLILSTFQNTEDIHPNIDQLLKSERFKGMERNALHATKSILSNHLSQLFGIGDDPFYSYSEYGYYRLKFHLLPPVGLRNNDVFISRKKKGFDDDPQLEENPY